MTERWHFERQNEEPSSGVITANFPPISSGGAALIAVDVIMLTLATTWTIMRIWARRHRNMSIFMVEDVLCYMALSCYFGSVAGHLTSVVIGGVGHHISTLSEFHIVRYSKLSFMAQIIYSPVIGFVKLSIIWMLQRIFFTWRFRFYAFVVMSIAVAWMTMPILVAVLVCRPIEFNWNKTVSGGYCGNKALAYSLVGVVDLISDTIIICLPMRMVYRLQVSTAHKLALAGIFGFGTIIMVFTALRLYYIYNLDFADITYSTVTPTIIGSVQMAIAIMVASSPLLRPIFDRTIGDCLGLSLRSGGRTKGSGVWSNEPTHGGELVTFGRPRRISTFQKMGGSEEELRAELSNSGLDTAVCRTTSVHAARAEEDIITTNIRGSGITVVSSTLITESGRA